MAGNIHMRGWYDTAETLGMTFQDDDLIRTLYTRNAPVDMMGDLLAEPDMVSKLAFYISYGKYLIHNRMVPAIPHIQAVSVGELVSPLLPGTYFPDDDTCRARITEIMTYYLETATPVTRGKTRIDFIESYNAIEENDRPEEWVELPADTTSEHIATNLISEYITFLVAGAGNQYCLTAVELFATVFAAVAKRGSVTDGFIEKLRQGIQDDLQIDARLDAEIMSRVYKFYGSHINSTNAQVVLTRWLNDIPEVALRLRLTLQQATNTGLTAYIVVGRAMMKYPTFPWARLNALTGNELTNYRAAVTAVNGNAYYGFNKTLGAVRSTLYSTVAFVAKELLINLNGEVSLKRYGGWIKAPKSAAIVRTMITNFQEQYVQNMENAVVNPQDDAMVQDILTTIGNEANVNMF